MQHARILITLLSFAGVASAQAQTFFAGTGHWYEAVETNVGITWNDARAAATAKGGYLASVHGLPENAFVYSLVTDAMFSPLSVNNDREGPWLGGYNDGAGWGWVSGEIFSFTNWYPGQPDGYGGTVQRTGLFGGAVPGARWGDHPSGLLSGYFLPRGYVVEYNADPVPEPASMVALGLGAFALLRRRRAGRVR